MGDPTNAGPTERCNRTSPFAVSFNCERPTATNALGLISNHMYRGHQIIEVQFLRWVKIRKCLLPTVNWGPTVLDWDLWSDWAVLRRYGHVARRPSQRPSTGVTGQQRFATSYSAGSVSSLDGFGRCRVAVRSVAEILFRFGRGQDRDRPVAEILLRIDRGQDQGCPLSCGSK